MRLLILSGYHRYIFVDLEVEDVERLLQVITEPTIKRIQHELEVIKYRAPYDQNSHERWVAKNGNNLIEKLQKVQSIMGSGGENE